MLANNPVAAAAVPIFGALAVGMVAVKVMHGVGEIKPAVVAEPLTFVSVAQT